MNAPLIRLIIGLATDTQNRAKYAATNDKFHFASSVIFDRGYFSSIDKPGAREAIDLLETCLEDNVVQIEVGIRHSNEPEKCCWDIVDNKLGRFAVRALSYENTREGLVIAHVSMR